MHFLLLYILYFQISFLIIFLLAIPFKFLVWDYPIDRDVWSKLDRAQIMAESEDMSQMVNEAIIGLETRNQISGHCALFFKTPSNDLSAKSDIDLAYKDAIAADLFPSFKLNCTTGFPRAMYSNTLFIVETLLK